MIGQGTTIRGSISGDEDLTIEGRVEGSIRMGSDVTVASAATVEATVDAQNIEVNGVLSGDVTAGTALTVTSSGTLVGNVETPRIHIADGAHFTGRVSMDFEIPSAN